MLVLPRSAICTWSALIGDLTHQRTASFGGLHWYQSDGAASSGDLHQVCLIRRSDPINQTHSLAKVSEPSSDTPLAIRWATHYVYKVQFDPSQINNKTEAMNKTRAQMHVCTHLHAKVHKYTQASPGMRSRKGQVIFEFVLGHNSVFKWRLWPYL